jgi:thiamine-phosphate pyrophosphorylase
MDVVGEALKAGAPAVQLRNKGESPRALVEVGRELRTITRDAGALLFVNDRVDVALAVEADGVHVGPDDLPVAAVRRIAPRGFLIGRSADEGAVARQAEADGADYIGCGTVFATSTKVDAGDVIGLEGLASVVRAVSLPVVGIGGITEARAPHVRAQGAAGVAVVGAVMRSPDVGVTIQRLLAPWG